MCKRCDEFKKKYPYSIELKKHKDTCLGSEISCAFDENGIFTTDNWNCITIGILRELVSKYGETKRDDNAAGSLDVLWIPENDGIDGYLIMSYYKSRGRIGQAYIFNDNEIPKILTEEYAEHIIRCYSERTAQQDVAPKV